MARKRLDKMPADGGRIYAKLAADVSRELVLALQTEGRERNLTKAEVARLIGRNKATITRALSGGNLELRTIAAILAALGHEMEVKAHRIEPPHHLQKNHVKHVQSEPILHEVTARVVGAIKTSETTPTPHNLLMF
jgi:DNA-binding phage protein